MSGIVTIHVGQAGVQMGSALWELLCLEHGIMPDGTLPSPAADDVDCKFADQASPAATHKFVPNSILVDTEPSVLDEIRSGPYKDLFKPDRVLSGKEDACSIQVKGHYTIGRELIDPVVNEIRKTIENVDTLQGIQLYHSLGGGTGSGLGGRIMERLSVDFGQVPTMSFSVWPSQRFSANTVEPYNATLSMSYLQNNVGMCVLMDNEALYRICQRQLDIECPNYTDVNRVVAQLSCSISASARFDSMLRMGLGDIRTMFNSKVGWLAQERTQNFLVGSVAPLSSKSQACSGAEEEDVTAQVFKPCNATLTSERAGTLLGACCMYRGDVTAKDVLSQIAGVRASGAARFVGKLPGLIRCAITRQPPVVVPGSGMGKVPRMACSLVNSTAVLDAFENTASKYDRLWSRRAFAHWFAGEGMESGEFGYKRELLESTIRCYQAFASDDGSEAEAYGGNESIE